MKVLFVCLGNICRSPTAEGLFRQQVAQAGLLDKISIDSAGTADWHTGKAPDPRTVAAAAERGVDLSTLKARPVTEQDFHEFDYILAMDESNLSNLKALQPTNAKATLDLFLHRFGITPNEVPDPYYGGPEGFEQVLDLVESGCQALLQEVREHV